MKENPLHVVKLEELSTKLPCFTYMLMQDDAQTALFFEVDHLVMHFFVVCCLPHFSATSGCKLFQTSWNINLPSDQSNELKINVSYLNRPQCSKLFSYLRLGLKKDMPAVFCARLIKSGTMFCFWSRNWHAQFFSKYMNYIL